MGYRQLGEDERLQIALLQAQGASVRQIAAALDRAPSTVARELKRNRSPAGKYLPGYAQQAAHARRWCGPRIERDSVLREQVMTGFARRWSPQQIAERLAWEEGRRVISHESIYRFVYAQIARTKDYSWRHCLPRAKARRGWRGRRGGSPAAFIAHRVPLTQRPIAATARTTFGHWEADLMAFGRTGPVVLALHERHSRLLLAVRQGGEGRRYHRRDPAAAPGSPSSPMAPDGHLRQRHRVRPPLPPPPPGHPDLLLRHPLPLAEGRGGERHRPTPASPPPQDQAGRPDRSGVYSSPAAVQQYPPQVPRLPHPRRGLPRPGVALQM